MPLLLLVVALLGASAASATAQELRMENSCPAFNSPDLHQYSHQQLIDLCIKKPAGQKPDCGDAMTLANAARMDNTFVEAQAVAAAAQDHCQVGTPVSQPIVESVTSGLSDGLYNYERGYNTRYSGAQAEICSSNYSGIARVAGGRISFSSGGHDWAGSVGGDGSILITRDGVTNPTPKNDTAIYGPVEDATLFNGYCGYGYFRITGRL